MISLPAIRASLPGSSPFEANPVEADDAHRVARVALMTEVVLELASLVLHCLSLIQLITLTDGYI